MKKLILGAVLAVFTLSIYSCRETNSEETTVETVEDDLDAEMEEMGDEMEEMGNDIEEGAEEVGDEIDAEVEIDDNDGL